MVFAENENASVDTSQAFDPERYVIDVQCLKAKAIFPPMILLAAG